MLAVSSLLCYLDHCTLYIAFFLFLFLKTPFTWAKRVKIEHVVGINLFTEIITKAAGCLPVFFHSGASNLTVIVS